MSDGDYTKYSRTRPYSKHRYSFTEEELDHMGEVILEAERIRDDDKIFRMVQQHLRDKGGEITRIQDIRDKMAQEDLTDGK